MQVVFAFGVQAKRTRKVGSQKYRRKCALRWARLEYGFVRHVAVDDEDMNDGGWPKHPEIVELNVAINTSDGSKLEIQAFQAKLMLKIKLFRSN